MRTIRFSYRYKKMPEGVEFLETFIKDIGLVDYKDLTPEQIKEDTEIVDGGFYSLPTTRLIWIKLWSDTIQGGKEWGTMRKYTPEKFEYYSSLVGQQVKIEIAPQREEVIRNG